MKNTFLLPKTLFVLFLLVGFSSCESVFEAEGDFSNEEFIEDFSINHEVQTFRPDVSSGTAVFKGEISFISGTESTEYGFMWYAPDDPQYNIPQRVPVGSTRTGKSFSITMTNLPLETPLVVCAFVKPESFQDDMIGDEEDFTVPL